MALADILNPDRVSVSCETEGLVQDKEQALRRLAALLANGQKAVSGERILEVLAEREKLQSTGVGAGVAVPHGSVAELDHQIGALLVCPEPIPFDAIDGQPVSIIFALVGPKGAPAEHLKLLARVSRLLRQPGFRKQLSEVGSGAEAYQLILGSEAAGT
ncbi:MAG: PTS sugar transporter subunit IIA [Myxococcales bacterium]|nr:PTS sugar transporter subunit IIA [Myxococcales bacterium]